MYKDEEYQIKNVEREGIAEDEQVGKFNNTNKECGGSQSSCRKWVRRILFSGVCFFSVSVLLFAGYVFVTNCKGDIARRRTLKQLRDRSLPTDTSYLGEEKEDFSSVGDEREPPPLSEEDKNGTRFYLAAFKVAAFPGGFRNDIPYQGLAAEPELCEPIDDNLGKAMKAYVDIQEDFYCLMEKARRRSRFNYGLDFVHDSGIPGSSLGVLASLRGAARNMQILCLHEQASGDAEKALDACAAIIDMNLSFNDEYWMIVWLVRTATGLMAFDSAEQTLSRTFPEKDSLQKVRKRLLSEFHSMDFRQMAECEIASLVEYLQYPGLCVAKRTWSIEEALSKKTWRLSLGGGGLDQAQPLEWKIRLGLATCRVWYTLCPGAWRLRFARRIEEELKNYDDLELPLEEVTRKANEVLEKNDNSQGLALPRGIIEILKHKARMKVCAGALSLEAYRIDHGKWPDALSELEEEEEMLKDPFTGNVLKYERTGSGCIVYSVGRNQRDDAGEQDYNVDRKDDIVFHLFNPGMRNKMPETPSGL